MRTRPQPKQVTAAVGGCCCCWLLLLLVAAAATCPLPLPHLEHHLLVPPRISLHTADHGRLPALTRRVALVHAQQVTRPDACLVTTSTSTVEGTAVQSTRERGKGGGREGGEGGRQDRHVSQQQEQVLQCSTSPAPCAGLVTLPAPHHCKGVTEAGGVCAMSATQLNNCSHLPHPAMTHYSTLLPQVSKNQQSWRFHRSFSSHPVLSEVEQRSESMLAAAVLPDSPYLQHHVALI